MQQPNDDISKRDEVREVFRLSKYLNQCCTLACTACEHGFQSYSAFKTHMRTKHCIRSAIDVEFTNGMLRANGLATLVPQAPADDSKSLCVPLNNIPKCIDGTAQLSPLQDVYWRAPQSLSSGNRVLTEILELALFTGTQCAHDKRSYCCKSKSGMRTHFQSKPSHRSSGFKNHAVYIQRLGESRNSKWFPVVSSNPSRAKASETTLRRSPEVPQAARCQAAIIKPAQFTAAVVVPSNVTDKNHPAEKGTASVPISIPSATQLTRSVVPGKRTTDLLSFSLKENERNEPGDKSSAVIDTDELNSKDASDHIWNLMKKLHPSSRGNQFRQENPKNAKGEQPINVADHQLLGRGHESDRRATELFVSMCQFKEALEEFGFSDIATVPFELISLKGDLLRHSNTDAAQQTSVGQDADWLSSEITSHEIALDRVMASLRFDENDISGHIRNYMREGRIATHSSADFVARLVCTKDQAGAKGGDGQAPNGKKRSSGKQSLYFNPVVADKTEEKYAKNAFRLVLFAIRTTMMKNVSFTGHPPHPVPSPASRASPDAENRQSPGMEFQIHGCDENKSCPSNDLTASNQTPGPFLNPLRRKGIRERLETLFRVFPAEIELAAQEYIKAWETWNITNDECAHRSGNSTHNSSRPSSDQREGLFSRTLAPSGNGGLARSFDRSSGAVENLTSLMEARNRVESALHFLIRSLLLRTAGNSPRSQELIVRNFVVNNSIWRNKTNDADFTRFKKASEMSHMFASLLYLSSCCGVLEMSLPDEGNMHFQEYAMYQSRGRDDTIESGGRNYTPYHRMTIEELKHSLSMEENSTVAFLRGILNRANHVRKFDSDKHVRVTHCLRHTGCAFIDGTECSLSDIRSLQKRLQNILKADLLLGQTLSPSFWAKLEGAQDNFMMHNRGMNFLSRAANEDFGKECGKMLVDHVLSKPVLRYRFFNVGSMSRSRAYHAASRSDSVPAMKQIEEVVQTDDAAVDKYLQSCDEALEIALTLAHLSAVAPARSTETSTYRLVNYAAGLRGFYVDKGSVC